MLYNLFEGSSKSEQGESYQINFTRKYDHFRTIEGNRDVNPGVVNKLVESININGYLMNPIFVNDKKEVIDGQHRLKALKELNMEVPYLVLDGYNGKEMQVLNQTGSNWGTKEFLKYWVTQGLKDYEICNEFYIKYKMFSLTTVIFMLSGVKSNHKVLDDKGHPENVFNKGDWEIESLQEAIDLAEYLINMQPLFPDGYNTIGFIQALLFLEGKYPDFFNRDEFKHKLTNRTNLLNKQSSWKHYIFPINDIYNMQRSKKAKLYMNETEY